jgi:hypothetical protein
VARVADSTSQLNVFAVLTRRKEVEGVSSFLALVVLDDNGVAGVVTTGAASADIGVGGENVDELALALVTPLGTKTLKLVSKSPREEKFGVPDAGERWMDAMEHGTGEAIQASADSAGFIDSTIIVEPGTKKMRRKPGRQEKKF